MAIGKLALALAKGKINVAENKILCIQVYIRTANWENSLINYVVYSLFIQKKLIDLKNRITRLVVNNYIRRNRKFYQRRSCN